MTFTYHIMENTALKNLYYKLKRGNNLENNMSDCSCIQREIINLLPQKEKMEFQRLLTEYINFPKPKSNYDKVALKMMMINDLFLKHLENILFDK